MLSPRRMYIIVLITVISNIIYYYLEDSENVQIKNIRSNYTKCTLKQCYYYAIFFPPRVSFDRFPNFPKDTTDPWQHRQTIVAPPFY